MAERSGTFIKRTDVWLGGRLILQTQMMNTGPTVIKPGGGWVDIWHRWLYYTDNWEVITEEQALELLDG